MKLNKHTLVLLPFGIIFLLLTTTRVIAVDPNEALSFFKELYEPDSKTNIDIVRYEHSSPSVLYSNTNFFTPDEQALLKQVFKKYANVTTNVGPPGSKLISHEQTGGKPVSHFVYPASGAKEDVYFEGIPPSRPKGSDYNAFLSQFPSSWVARFRSTDQTGYDVIVDPKDNRAISFVAQISKSTVNGLFISFEKERCQELLHFVHGKAVGKWLQWGPDFDKVLIEANIKSPLDYFKYQTREMKN